jgi:hypothetical protein
VIRDTLEVEVDAAVPAIEDLLAEAEERADQDKDDEDYEG